jgi:Protein of unknown function (DUF3631)
VQPPVLSAPDNSADEGAALLDEVAGLLGRFVVMSGAQRDAGALWVVHGHALDAAGMTPYLAITSPEKRSGKTRLLEVLALLVHEPLSTANISDAALFRVVDRQRPTLLIDEVDAIFGNRGREREELRGLLCAGYRAGATTHRMGGPKHTELQTFSVYCAKAFAGIGDCLPDTVSDRSIPIRLKRRTRDEQVERFRLRDVEHEATDLRERLAGWIEPRIDRLAALRPDLPDELDDRAQDVWEPLFAIADLAGGDWPERARAAALELSTGEERDTDSLTGQLIRDIHAVFIETDGEPLRTAKLIERLSAIEESPWGDYHGPGRSITAQALSRLLRAYRIKTMPIWTKGQTARGYKLEQFADAFLRVLGVRSVSGVRSGFAARAEPNAPNAPNAHPHEQNNGQHPDALHAQPEADDDIPF